MWKLPIALVLAIALQGDAYTLSVETFHKNRAADIGAETGWAALTDLHWVDNGQFTVGRGAANAIVLTAPSCPERLGTLTVTGTHAVLHVAPDVIARVKGERAVDVELHPDAPASEGVVVNGMTLTFIDRSGRHALRVWDRQSPGRQAFRGLKWYPIGKKWRVDARFVAHAPAPTMKIQNIVGQVVDMSNPGAAEFTIGGQAYRLEALRESPDDNELFFMFRDATSGKATYGSGRYLYTELPKDGRVTLDFNLAINPPCAFTAFATCPLPPPQNRLTLAIEAGELLDGH